ncbi:MAG TPA: hypothetical protein PLW77_05355 [Bacteroidales bacterium]|nr:hypothetical protein [Bacteroidales bacterium]
MNWIKSYLNNSSLCELQNKVDKIEKNNSYRSWIGFNFYENNIYSVKFYYTFYQVLSQSEINSLFITGNSNDFYDIYKYASLNDILRVKDAGSGITFSVKVNCKDESSFGFYLKRIFNDNDDYFTIPETKEYLRQGGNITNIDFVKNSSVFYTQNTKETKDYYYIKDPIYKQVIANLFDEPMIAKVPVIEYAVGKGNRDNSDDMLSKRKAVLFGDFKETADYYLNIWKDIKTIVSPFLNKGYQIFCPAIYGDKKFYSIYLFNFAQDNRLIEQLLKI